MIHSLKNYFRRRALARAGIRVTRSCTTLSAGARSGVWTVCPDALSSSSIVYSFGVGDNLAWDLAMVDRFGVTLHAFDPTPASIAWVARQTLPARLHFHPLGVAAHDGTIPLTLRGSGSGMNFRPPEHVKPAARSETPDELKIDAPVKRIATLARELGHTQVDLIKMDIEGGEYAVIDDLLAGVIRPRQLLVEFHHHFPGVGVEKTTDAVRSLARAGYELFHLSPRGLEMSFLRNDG